MSKETAFYPRLQALTDQWMDLFGYLARSSSPTYSRSAPCAKGPG